MQPHERQPSYAAAFAAALVDPELETPAIVADPAGKGAVKRYNLYRNNVTVSLIEALVAIYPAVQRITGVDFFRAMARFHIRATPPTYQLSEASLKLMESPAVGEMYQFALPTTVVIDRQGIIRGKWQGYRDGYERQIADLLAELLGNEKP